MVYKIHIYLIFHSYSFRIQFAVVIRQDVARASTAGLERGGNEGMINYRLAFSTNIAVRRQNVAIRIGAEFEMSGVSCFTSVIVLLF